MFFDVVTPNLVCTLVDFDGIHVHWPAILAEDIEHFFVNFGPRVNVRWNIELLKRLVQNLEEEKCPYFLFLLGFGVSDHLQVVFDEDEKTYECDVLYSELEELCLVPPETLIEQLDPNSFTKSVAGKKVFYSDVYTAFLLALDLMKSLSGETECPPGRTFRDKYEQKLQNLDGNVEKRNYMDTPVDPLLVYVRTIPLDDKEVDLHHLHEGLRAALSGLRETCENSDVEETAETDSVRELVEETAETDSIREFLNEVKGKGPRPGDYTRRKLFAEYKQRTQGSKKAVKASHTFFKKLEQYNFNHEDFVHPYMEKSFSAKVLRELADRHGVKYNKKTTKNELTRSIVAATEKIQEAR